MGPWGNQFGRKIGWAILLDLNFFLNYSLLDKEGLLFGGLPLWKFSNCLPNLQKEHYSTMDSLPKCGPSFSLLFLV